MSSTPILVTGATGKTGRRVAALLTSRGVPIRAVSRTSTIPFDWNDAATWPAAVDGIGAAYIVHPGLGSSEAAEEVKSFAKIAAAAGVTRAVMLTTPDDGSEFSKSMRVAEKNVIDAGLALVSLRLRWFYQNFSEDFLLPAVLSGELRLPAAQGKEAFVDADDIAEVAVAALTDERHDGHLYDVTGPKLLAFDAIAEEITQGAGHPVRYVPLTPEDYVAEQLALGVPADWAYALSAMYQDIANGKLETLSGDVETILGKPPRAFADFVSHAAREGVWSKQ